MSSRLRPFVFAALLLGAAPGPAAAQFWDMVDWIEKLSGPGPFRGVVFGVPVACRVTFDRRVSINRENFEPEIVIVPDDGPGQTAAALWSFEGPSYGKAIASAVLARGYLDAKPMTTSRQWCVDFSYSHTANSFDDSAQNGRLAVDVWDGRFVYKSLLYESIELAAHAGVIHYKSQARSHTTPYVSPVGLAVKPLKLFAAPFGVQTSDTLHRDWLDLIQIRAAWSVLYDEVTDERLGLTGYDFNHRFRFSGGVMVDLSQIFLTRSPWTLVTRPKPATP